MNYFFMVEYVITRQIKIAVLQNETKALSEKSKTEKVSQLSLLWKLS